MKIYLISILCLLSLRLRAQQITVGGVAQISDTKELKPLSSAEMLEKPKGLLDKSDVKYLPKDNKIYEKDGVYIGLWQVIEGITKRTLTEIQKEKVYLYNLDKTSTLVSSEIKNYSSINYLIINTQENDECYYRFNSQPHNGLYLNGFIKYKKEDKDKAAAILKDLLNNAKFKN
ncbi:hypothetical protein [Pedobacter endophyticus]|uniref:DUF4468 domain-containing protein n=1 Tax=Pedobacter endophyticus TaxID=2789740 RepID=A0A7U3Q557_9SPHI|nr:hypothetical protein [Pedobacter endophyticus]QPH38754.1 hypothetical protein IZT61_17020 [Pedobacter endophyticus]